MVTVGTYEAKTHLPRLLERVSRGETVLITRHGKPVARIVPIAGPEERPVTTDFVEAFRRLRKKAKPGASIRELIEEGRR